MKIGDLVKINGALKLNIRRYWSPTPRFYRHSLLELPLPRNKTDWDGVGIIIGFSCQNTKILVKFIKSNAEAWLYKDFIKLVAPGG